MKQRPLVSSFASIPDEVVVRIFGFIPVMERLVLQEVSQRFKRIARWMVTGSEDMFRHKLLKGNENMARKSLLQYRNLRMLNMDLAVVMFADMDQKERHLFAQELSYSCPLIEVVYLSHYSCFDIISEYCQHLGKSRIRSLRAVVPMGKQGDTVSPLLQTIRSKSPLLQQILLIPGHDSSDTNCESEEEESEDEFSYEHESEFEIMDEDRIRCMD